MPWAPSTAHTIHFARVVLEPGIVHLHFVDASFWTGQAHRHRWMLPVRGKVYL